MSFLFIKKALRLNNLKTRTAMNVKILVFVTCVEAIIYLLLWNLHDCTFNQWWKKVRNSHRRCSMKKGPVLISINENLEQCTWNQHLSLVENKPESSSLANAFIVAEKIHFKWIYLTPFHEKRLHNVTAFMIKHSGFYHIDVRRICVTSLVKSLDKGWNG